MTPPVKILLATLVVLFPLMLIGMAVTDSMSASVPLAPPPPPAVAAPVETAQQTEERIEASNAELTQQFAANDGGQTSGTDLTAQPASGPVVPGQPMLDPQPALDPTPAADRAAGVGPATVDPDVASGTTVH